MTLDARRRRSLVMAVAAASVVLLGWLGEPSSAQTAAPAAPTPRLADGTPNLGRVPGEKGAWGVPYITNMAARVILEDGTPAVSSGGRGRSRGPRGGSASEPHIPFMPWSAAIYDYNSANASKYVRVFTLPLPGVGVHRSGGAWSGRHGDGWPRSFWIPASAGMAVGGAALRQAQVEGESPDPRSWVPAFAGATRERLGMVEGVGGVGGSRHEAGRAIRESPLRRSAFVGGQT